MASNSSPKMKKTGNPNIGSGNIQSGHRDGIWHRKMCHANNAKRKTQITEGIELPNEDKIRTLGEKETYKNLGILEADTIKQAQIKEKILKGNERNTQTQTI